MKHILPLLAISMLMSLSTTSMAQTTDDGLGAQGRVVGETIFATIASGDRDAFHTGDLEVFRASVFGGMDYNGDHRVTHEEFSQWDPGFAAIAQELGRSEAYVTASKIVFAFWDRDGSGELVEPEMRFAMTADFRRADLDDDGLLSREEFIQSFPIMVAMRAAIRPDL